VEHCRPRERLSTKGRLDSYRVALTFSWANLDTDNALSAIDRALRRADHGSPLGPYFLA
jgi:hypothetical protein